ncbi:MAG: hypothetical protein WKF36_09390 [Candidatus Nitrosocosmicus sp.]
MFLDLKWLWATSAVSIYKLETYEEKCVKQFIFDLSSNNIERTTKFHRELFGWKKIERKGMDDTALEDNRQYFIVTTKDNNGIGALYGGMMERQGPQHQGITNYNDVKSV